MPAAAAALAAAALAAAALAAAALAAAAVAEAVAIRIRIMAAVAESPPAARTGRQRACGADEHDDNENQDHHCCFFIFIIPPESFRAVSGFASNTSGGRISIHCGKNFFGCSRRAFRIRQAAAAACFFIITQQGKKYKLPQRFRAQGG